METGIDMSVTVELQRYKKCPKCGSTELKEYTDPEGSFWECSCYTDGHRTRICRCGAVLKKRRTNNQYDCENDKCDVSRVKFSNIGLKMGLVVTESSYVGDNK